MMHFSELGYIEKQEKIWRFLFEAANKEEGHIRNRYISEESVFEWEVARAAVEEAVKQRNYYANRVREADEAKKEQESHVAIESSEAES